MADKLRVKILKGGIIRVTSGEISMAHHTNAEGLLEDLARLAGGEVKVESGHLHSHEGESEHEHEH